MNNSLNKKEVDEICYRYVKGVDKWNRMYKGFSTNLTRYEEGVMYIEFSNTKKVIETNSKNIAAEVIKWRNSNEELKNATGFVVVCKVTNVQQGGVIGFNELKNYKIFNSIMQSMKLTKDSVNQIEKIYSGIFP